MVDDNLMRFFQSDGGGDKIQKTICKTQKQKIQKENLMTIFQPNGGGDTHGTAGHRGCCESRSYMDFRW